MTDLTEHLHVMFVPELAIADVSDLQPRLLTKKSKIFACHPHVQWCAEPKHVPTFLFDHTLVHEQLHTLQCACHFHQVHFSSANPCNFVATAPLPPSLSHGFFTIVVVASPSNSLSLSPSFVVLFPLLESQFDNAVVNC